MQNIDVKVTGDKLVLTVDLSKRHGRSASGKNVIIASSQGNQKLPDGKGSGGVSFGLNVYTKAEAEG